MPQTEKEWYLQLHYMLDQYRDALSASVIPHLYEAEGCQEIATVMKMIEARVPTLPDPS